jgi:sugar/nucleoside kinase (ribokinase family)
MNQSKHVLVMGDVMIDIDANIFSFESLLGARGSDLPTHIQLTQGGSAANTALWMAHESHPVFFLGSVGKDGAGDYASTTLRNNGVMPLLKIDPHNPTGMCIVLTESDGSRTMLPSAGSNAHMIPAELESLWPRQELAHFHLSAYSLFHSTTAQSAVSALQRARDSGLTISIDPASHALLSRHKNTILESLRFTDVLLANQEEAQELYRLSQDDPYPSLVPHDQILRALLTLLNQDSPVAGTVVMTLEKDGAIALTGSGSMEYSPITSTGQIISTAGAGDAFNAGFLHRWIPDPNNLQSALRHGNQTAALALTRVGASPEPENS